MDDFDTIVVGGGVIGAAVFAELAKRRGARLLLIERRLPGSGATAMSGAVCSMTLCWHLP